MQGICPEVYMEKAFATGDFEPAQRLPVARELGERACALFIWARLTNVPSERGLHNLVIFTYWLPVLQNGIILRPIVALEVITLWGILTYFLFALKIKWFIKSPLIVGGMLVPFLTYFNPMFVDMFLRYHSASLIYRFGYIVPVAFVGGAAAVDAALKLIEPSDGRGLFKTAFRRGMSLVMLNVIRGLTHHRVRTTRFDQPNRLLRIESPDTPLSDAFRGVNLRHDWLMIINRRDGALSNVGEVSLHWPADILQVSRHYPDVMVEYIENRPDVFIKIWERNDIAVYDIDTSSF